MCNINRKEVEYEPGQVKLIWHPAATTSSLLASLIPMSAEATIELTREFNASTRELKVKVAGKSLKNLAYIIRKNRKAHYVMLNIELGGDKITELERRSRIDEDVIRFLNVRVDELASTPSIMMKKNTEEAE